METEIGPANGINGAPINTCDVTDERHHNKENDRAVHIESTPGLQGFLRVRNVEFKFQDAWMERSLRILTPLSPSLMIKRPKVVVPPFR